MIIGWDGTPFLRQEDGVGRFSSELLKAVSRVTPEHRHVIIGFSGDQDRPRLVEESANVSYQYLPTPRRSASTRFKLTAGPSFTDQLDPKPEVMVYSNFVRFPRLDGVPSITFVHDLVHHALPATVTLRNRWYLERFVPRSIKESTAVATISEFVAESITKAYKPAAKPRVIYPGVDARFAATPNKAELERVRRRYGLPEQFILFIGSLQPRKNLGVLIDAFNQLPANIQQEIPLVLGGASGWRNSDLQSKIGHNVFLPGFIEEADLPALYAAATIFVFPSLYEGFGIPPLEAMAAGTPVVAANTTALPESVGDAALLVDPEDVKALTGAMHKLLTDEQVLRDYIQRGRARAAEFTWDRAAQEFLKLVGEVAS